MMPAKTLCNLNSYVIQLVTSLVADIGVDIFRKSGMLHCMAIVSPKT